MFKKIQTVKPLEVLNTEILQDGLMPSESEIISLILMMHQ